MPEIITRPDDQTMADPSPERIRWMRADCARLLRSGVLEGEKYELLEGDLVRKVKNRPHVLSLARLLRWLNAVFGERYVQGQDPINVAPGDNRHNEPEPDAAVLARPVDDYPDAAPKPADLRLVVEVADATKSLSLHDSATLLRKDTVTKARLYARARIADYWVLDVAGRRLLVHRQPRAGRYVSVVAYAEHEAVAPLAAPEHFARVADLLPPPPPSPAAPES